MDSFATVAEVSGIAEHAINMALKKFEEYVIDMDGHTIIDTQKNCDSVHRKVCLSRNLERTKRSSRVCPGAEFGSLRCF